jgi:hypothetical protein
MEAEGKQREAESFRQSADSHACQTCKPRTSRVEKTKDNEGMNQSRMEAGGKQREAERFRQSADLHACQIMQTSEMKS